MELVFIAPEIVPYSRAGEIGDVCAALPKALRGGGHKVTVISPLWPEVDATARGLARRLSGVEVQVAGKRYACTLHDGRTTGGVELVFVGQAELFAAGPAAGDARAAFDAALGFAHAAAQVIAAREPAPDVVHAHGWFAAAALPLLEALLPSAARSLSVHDPEQRGPFPAGVDAASLPHPRLAECAGQGAGASLLRAGIAAAQRVVASCDADGARLRDPELGLADALDEKLVVIQNGLDAARWNTLTDPLLPSRFDPVDRRGKARCKDALQLELGLPIAPDVPLIACIGTLGPHSGGGLLARALPALLHNDLQLVIVGGDAELTAIVETLAARYEERLRSSIALDERSAHRAIAAADLALVPGRDPAFPDLHLAAQRYGAVPIARKVGAVADAVVDCDAQLATGTGFLFESDDPAELVAAVQRGLAGYARRQAFEELRSRVMKLDVSWERAARRYEHAFKTIKAE